MNKKEAERYQLIYPHYLPWVRRVGVIRRGQKLLVSGEPHVVTQVVRSPIAKEPPRIVVEPITLTESI